MIIDPVSCSHAHLSVSMAYLPCSWLIYFIYTASLLGSVKLNRKILLRVFRMRYFIYLLGHCYTKFLSSCFYYFFHVIVLKIVLYIDLSSEYNMRVYDISTPIGKEGNYLGREVGNKLNKRTLTPALSLVLKHIRQWCSTICITQIWYSR